MYGKGFPDNRSKAQVEEDTHGGAPRARPRGTQVFAEKLDATPPLWQLVADKHNGFLSGGFTITAYNINGRLVLLQEFGSERGQSWEAYVPVIADGRISKTVEAIKAGPLTREQWELIRDALIPTRNTEASAALLARVEALLA